MQIRCSSNKALFIFAAEPSSVTTEELTQHKNYLKVIKRQEREMKDAEKKYQKKTEDLIQKYSEAFKAIKKKASLKKKEYVHPPPHSSFFFLAGMQ